MLRRRLAVLLVAVALIASGGCSAGAKQASSAKQDKYNTKERTDQIPVRLTIELGGDLQSRIESQTLLTQLVHIESGDPELAKSRIFGMETVEPIKVGTTAFMAGFAVSPYLGPRTYTIQPGSVQDTAALQKEGKPVPDERSSIKVLWWPTAGNNDLIYDYYRREMPCTVVVEGNDGSRGTLDCPRVTQDGRPTHFSLKMQWEFA